MRIEIEIPKEFEGDYDADRFKNFFNRVLTDIIFFDGLCGNYEKETAEMLQKAFSKSKVAYDAEAVIAELEKIKKVSACDEIRCDECKYTKICFEGEKSYKVALDRAISIVRGKEQP